MADMRVAVCLVATALRIVDWAEKSRTSTEPIAARVTISR